MDAEKLGRKLVKARERAGLKQKEAAEKIGITNDKLCKYEKGKNIPPYDILMKLAKLYGVHVNYFLENNSGNNNLYSLYPAGKFVRIPVYGTIRAGNPIYADEEIIGYEWVPEEEVRSGEHFFLRVTGDSMKDIGIFDGSLILVRKQSTVNNGDIAVVLLKETEEATVKRIYFQDGVVILKPENPAYDLQIYKPEEVLVLGKVVMELKRF